MKKLLVCLLALLLAFSAADCYTNEFLPEA